MVMPAKVFQFLSNGFEPSFKLTSQCGNILHENPLCQKGMQLGRSLRGRKKVVAVALGRPECIFGLLQKRQEFEVVRIFG